MLKEYRKIYEGSIGLNLSQERLTGFYSGGWETGKGEVTKEKTGGKNAAEWQELDWFHQKVSYLGLKENKAG